MAGSHHPPPLGGGSRVHGLRHLLAALLPAMILLLVSIPAVNAETCYRLDGQVMVNNRRCPGSNACCGEAATCLSNRLCHNDGDPPDLFVRGPCYMNGWNGNTDCAQICLYNETATNRMPRVNVCADGSLCCDDNKNCCAEKKGIFLDENGIKVSARATGVTLSFPPGVSSTSISSSTSSSSTTSTTAITTTLTTQTTPSTPTGTGSGNSESSSTNAADSDATAESSSSDSTGLKVGLGLGIPLAVIVSALLVYCLLRRKQKAEAAQEKTTPPSEMHGESTYISEAPPNYMPGPPGQGYMYAHKKPENTAVNPYPVEIGEEMRSEMEGNHNAVAAPRGGQEQRYYEMG
ncbi:hypothetical protein QBC43DRAFT_318848 [Cladorrhinum sp. PSN259]|nr:hypothetical protein QBC43DRAFT_318848 [Cladorrhinum sp. PSN259]